MFGRTFLFVAVLVVAVALPYVLMRDSNPATTADDATEVNLTQTASKTSNQPDNRSATSGRFHRSTVTTSDRGQSTAPLPLQAGKTTGKFGPAGLSIADLLTFNANRSWITRNWPRVTTSLAELSMTGMRVPVMTGTEEHDVAGSITYYFNYNQQVQRIVLHGYTGDFEPLATFVQQRFGLRQYASVGPGLYMSFADDIPISVLEVRNAPVAGSQDLFSRFEVQLELNAGLPGTTLSSESLERLNRLRAANML